MAPVMSGNANPAHADSFISRSMPIAPSSPSVARRSLAPCLPADGGPHPTSAPPPGGHPALRPTSPLFAPSSPSVARRSLAPCLPADGGPHPTSAPPPGGHPALRPTASAGRRAPSPNGGERVGLAAPPGPFHGQLLEPAVSVDTHLGGD